MVSRAVLELVLATVISAWVKARTFTPQFTPSNPHFTHNPKISVHSDHDTMIFLQS